MPANDKYQKTVTNALIKDGWQIADEQIALPIEGRNLWIDIEAVKTSSEKIILIEVKGFENIASPINYFQQVVGQLIMYRTAIKYWNLDSHILYLAIPDYAYNSFFQETIVKLIITELELKLLIFNPEKEEITVWVN